jgi:hypothetical protein
LIYNKIATHYNYKTTFIINICPDSVPRNFDLSPEGRMEKIFSLNEKNTSLKRKLVSKKINE